ncbi:hypothetical protein LX32DRAFT_35759 [Colletotrichum zoysiae]|uniref:Uncharacterized protein n=1 Tax=Colletotrichum zoysiae TaxID=1216348 RepID=A0AAD9HBR2_9PEZI|nr:hypothetical protein LX32DRAFT_35759 [Colletotrichum zoysiae]
MYVWYDCRCMYDCLTTDCGFCCPENKKDGNKMLKSLDLLIPRARACVCMCVCVCVCVCEPAGDVLVTRLLHEKGGLYGSIHWMSAACCWPQNKKKQDDESHWACGRHGTVNKG